MFFVFFIGTAGSGKSTLTGVFAEWLKQHDVNVATVNLDPGVRKLPYAPDVDVRDYVRVEDVMLNYELGPNGALILSIDMLIGEIDRLKNEIGELRPDYVLVDTPGQMELFAYRSVGPYLVSVLGGDRCAIVYLVDGVLASNPLSYVSIFLLGLSVQYRFNKPQIYVLTKKDMLSEEDLNRILEWSEDHMSLLNAIDLEGRGLRREMSLRICELLSEMGLPSGLILTSSVKWEGLDDLYAVLQRICAGGEDFVVYE
ncbi:MAG: ATP/GTP-binding protein [Candidatus Baldrarchaeia archaeon]